MHVVLCVGKEMRYLIPIGGYLTRRAGDMIFMRERHGIIVTTGLMLSRMGVAVQVPSKMHRQVSVAIYVQTGVTYPIQTW